MKAVPIDAASDAAAWLVKNQAGLNAEDALALERWLQESPTHWEAFREAEATWRTLHAPRNEGQAREMALLFARARARRVRRRWVAGTAAMATLVVVGAFLAPSSVTPRSQETTVAVRPDRRALPDGSTVELNAGAEFTLDYGSTERRVRLAQGEALFEVARDPQRPFVVWADGVAVRALGTAFAVRLEAATVRVLVTEGRVSVERTTAQTRPDAVTLEVGDTVVVAPESEGLAPPKRVDPTQAKQELAWRARRVEFTETPLAEAVALFNRENRLQLVVKAASLAQLRLNGIFWSDDPEGFVRLLEQGFVLKTERVDGAIMLRP